MRRPVVVCDLDGVVGKFVDAFLSAYRAEGGEIPPHFEVDCWGFPDLLPNQKAVIKAWRNPKIFLDQEPYPGAIKALKLLHDNFDLVIATSAAPPLGVHIPAKMRWLSDKAPFVTSSQLVFTGRKSLIRGSVFIDDYHENCFQWKRANKSGQVYMIARPWNADFHEEAMALGIAVHKGELLALARELTEVTNGQ